MKGKASQSKSGQRFCVCFTQHQHNTNLRISPLQVRGGTNTQTAATSEVEAFKTCSKGTFESAFSIQPTPLSEEKYSLWLGEKKSYFS